MRQELGAEDGQRHGTRSALDQLDLEQRFEVLQAPREGSLGDVQRLGRFLKAALFRDGDESLQPERVDFHDFDFMIQFS